MPLLQFKNDLCFFKQILLVQQTMPSKQNPKTSLKSIYLQQLWHQHVTVWIHVSIKKHWNKKNRQQQTDVFTRFKHLKKLRWLHYWKNTSKVDKQPSCSPMDYSQRLTQDLVVNQSAHGNVYGQQ